MSSSNDVKTSGSSLGTNEQMNNKWARDNQDTENPSDNSLSGNSGSTVTEEGAGVACHGVGGSFPWDEQDENKSKDGSQTPLPAIPQEQTAESVNAVEPLKQTTGSKAPEIVGMLAGTVILIALIVLLVYLKLTKRKKPMKRDISSTTGSPAGYNADPNAVKVIDSAKGCPVRIARIHGQGRRSSQQDSFGFSDTVNMASIREKGLFAVVADGMGGLEDGDRMSSMVVVSMLEGFDKSSGMDDPSSLLLKLLDDANDAVNDDLGAEKTGQCGSTVVSVIIRNRMLYYLSVGDSHIYLYRRGVLKQINRDHNYAAQLDEMARNGEISLDEAALDPQRAALTSFIGMGDIELVDRNEQPIPLEIGDRILLMSDGIYGTIHDEGIAYAMEEPLIRACYRINEMIYDEDKPNQDNFTCAILEITG